MDQTKKIIDEEKKKRIAELYLQFKKDLEYSDVRRREITKIIKDRQNIKRGEDTNAG